MDNFNENEQGGLCILPIAIILNSVFRYYNYAIPMSRSTFAGRNIHFISRIDDVAHRIMSFAADTSGAGERIKIGFQDTYPYYRKFFRRITSADLK